MTRFSAPAQCGGCGAKAAPSAVERAVAAARSMAPDPRVLVGLNEPDDAAVHLVAPGRAVVTTVDMFPPPVDDPADVGAICAANAVSDVYAMGGAVETALIIAAFPREASPADIAAAIEAAAAVVRECGGTVVGGHTVHSPAPLLGLSVSGSVDPGAVWRKHGARPGDALVLSKPLGTGLALAGGDEHARAEAVEVMRLTNRAAADELHRVGPSAVTDLTGFGLLGHLLQMTSPSVSVEVDTASLPLLACVRDGRTGRSSAHGSNAAHVRDVVAVDWADPASDVLVDPQTSGGLLAAVPAERVDQLSAFTAIGRFTEADSVAVRVR